MFHVKHLSARTSCSAGTRRHEQGADSRNPIVSSSHTNHAALSTGRTTGTRGSPRPGRPVASAIARNALRRSAVIYSRSRIDTQRSRCWRKHRNWKWRRIMNEIVRCWLVKGIVQGVGFRHWTRREAARISVRGFVRNLPDGSVEVQAAGTPKDIADLEQRLHQGPPGAQVISVERGQPEERLPTGFDIYR